MRPADLARVVLAQRWGRIDGRGRTDKHASETEAAAALEKRAAA